MTYLEKVLEGLSGQSKLRKSTNHSTWTTEKWLCLKNDFKKSDTYLQTVIWIQFVKWVQSLSRVWLFVTSWTAVCRASLSLSVSRSLLKLISIELVMPSNLLVPSCPLLLLPSIFPSIRVFCKESALCLRWPKYWSFSFSISHSN